MKSKTNNRILVGSSLALALALAVWSPLQAQPADSVEPVKMTDSQMAEHCKAMKAQHQKMCDDCKAQDAQLTSDIAAMNAAPADKKVDLIAAALTRVVEQRIAMDARRATMDEAMMKHMMEHMQMGKDSMPGCPMMKGMDEKSDGSKK